MKFKFGKKSEMHLDQTSSGLSFVMREALARGVMDFTIIESFRDEETQNAYFYAEPQKSRVKFPHGKHNKKPAKAVDAVPWINRDVSWNKLHCCVLAGVVLAVASNLGIKIRWGCNWDMDSEPITDQDFQDLVHFEEVD